MFLNNLLNKVFRVLVEESLKGVSQISKNFKMTSKSPNRAVTELKNSVLENSSISKSNLTPERGNNLKEYHPNDEVKFTNKIHFNQNITKSKLNSNLNNVKKDKNTSLPLIK